MAADSAASTLRHAGPRAWLVLVLTLLGMALTARLGIWQLDRAAQKRALQAQIEARSLAPRLGNADLAAVNEMLMQRRVDLHGLWLNDKTVYLDNRPMKGRAGFFVLTPLQLSGTKLTVLVQRGWIPRDAADRSRLPAVPRPADEVRVLGRLVPSPSRVYELGAGASGAIRQNLDPQAYGRELGLPVPAAAVLEDGSAADGLLRDWPAPAVDIQKHYGYAFQWFALCVLMLGLYVWFQFIRPVRVNTRV
ncbi:MAG: SURF1 family protein [Burkholderiaceae bacterium]|nr:SURF1 family protein [Roseateles sp.]MBV8470952.1 SURF1 family protein [Burkholderiaceae bacterium]